MTLNNYGMSARLIEMGEIANETHRVINKQGKLRNFAPGVPEVQLPLYYSHTQNSASTNIYLI